MGTETVAKLILAIPISPTACGYAVIKAFPDVTPILVGGADAAAVNDPKSALNQQHFREKLRRGLDYLSIHGRRYLV